MRACRDRFEKQPFDRSGILLTKTIYKRELVFGNNNRLAEFIPKYFQTNGYNLTAYGIIILLYRRQNIILYLQK